MVWEKLKTAAIFIDQTAGFDTVWREGMLYMYLRVSHLRSQEILREDLDIVGQYFTKWWIQPNDNKTEVSCFHFNHKLVRIKLDIQFDYTTLTHNRTPKYLGITLDKTLSFKEHLTKAFLCIGFCLISCWIVCPSLAKEPKHTKMMLS